ncbi:antA/AntB antirepressor family protein [Faecalibaculum rodentium]|uniref:antA/AntB antirepressor family protein n=1 Tax=Faecalibaculum rodentium TaxID=1702221 RepID=UPI0025723816|nr:antA/AntB antirepressor family protein [Faecalibaculum rodentium]
MNELKIFNSDLIPVYTTDTGEKVVIGRELHDALGIKSQYKDWFPRMADYGFSEGVDFNLLKNERVHKEGNRTVKRMVIDHILKFDMAKHICMIQRTETGKAIRQKLIDLEKAINGKDSYMIEDPIERAKVWIKEQEARKQLEMKNAAQSQQIQ